MNTRHLNTIRGALLEKRERVTEDIHRLRAGDRRDYDYSDPSTLEGILRDLDDALDAVTHEIEYA